MVYVPGAVFPERLYHDLLRLPDCPVQHKAYRRKPVTVKVAVEPFHDKGMDLDDVAVEVRDDICKLYACSLDDRVSGKGRHKSALFGLADVFKDSVRCTRLLFFHRAGGLRHLLGDLGVGVSFPSQLLSYGRIIFCPCLGTGHSEGVPFRNEETSDFRSRTPLRLGASIACGHGFKCKVRIASPASSVFVDDHGADRLPQRLLDFLRGSAGTLQDGSDLLLVHFPHSAGRKFGNHARHHVPESGGVEKFTAPLLGVRDYYRHHHRITA